MNCTTCGTALPPGVAFCPNCGAAAPSSPPPYPPTAYGGQTYGGETYGTSAPTYLSDPYSRNPYQPGAAPLPSTNPYNPPQPPVNPYNPPPQSTNPYNSSPPPANPYPYNPSPPQNYPAGGTFAPQIPQPPPSPPARNRTGLIIGIVVLLLVLVGGGIFAATQLTKDKGSPQAAATPTPTMAPTAMPTTAPTATSSPTPSPPVASVGPSGSPIVASATQFFTNIQMASAINSTSFFPTKLSKTFVVKQNVYLTFIVNLHGQPEGYLVAKWYIDGVFGKSNNVLHATSNGPGYFGLFYNVPGNGAVELYWCQQSNCSDEQLAAVETFTITAS